VGAEVLVVGVVAVWRDTVTFPEALAVIAPVESFVAVMLSIRGTGMPVTLGISVI
jgi:hypothetical protein